MGQFGQIVLSVEQLGVDLNEALLFARVAELGSFTGAARALGLPKSTVSRKVAELETRLGARLMQRTTRKLHLTDAGRLYYHHAARAVLEVEDAELAVARLQDAPRGLLRVTAPLNFDYLAPIVTDFLQRYPEVDLELVCTDRVVDLVEEGFDLGIRAGKLGDSSLVGRPLGHLRTELVASAAFASSFGLPKEPCELERFPALVFGAARQREVWMLERGAESVTVRLRARYIANDFELLRQSALSGLGIANLPIARIAADLRERRLVRALPGWSQAAAPLSAVYPSARLLSPKVRVLLDFLKERLTPPPWEQGPALD